MKELDGYPIELDPGAEELLNLFFDREVAPHAFIDVVKELPLAEIITITAVLKYVTEWQDRQKKDSQKVLDTLRLAIIPDRMDDDGINSIDVIGVGKVSLTSGLNASIPAAKRESAYAWLEDNGYGDLIQETVNASTLKAWVTKLIKDKGKLPEDLAEFVVVRAFTRASIPTIKKEA